MTRIVELDVAGNVDGIFVTSAVFLYSSLPDLTNFVLFFVVSGVLLCSPFFPEFPSLIWCSVEAA